MEKITDCHTESQELRPRAVDGVSINGDTSTASLDWEPSDAALMYHVYHKRKVSREFVPRLYPPSNFSFFLNADV